MPLTVVFHSVLVPSSVVLLVEAMDTLPSVYRGLVMRTAVRSAHGQFCWIWTSWSAMLRYRPAIVSDALPEVVSARIRERRSSRSSSKVVGCPLADTYLGLSWRLSWTRAGVLISRGMQPISFIFFSSSFLVCSYAFTITP